MRREVETPEAAMAGLKAVVAGDVLLPDSPGYDAARRPAGAPFRDARPAAVVLCRHAADVAETIAFARRSGLPVVPRSGGHCFAGRSSTDGIVLDVSPMDDVAVSGGIATIGAGTRLGALYDRLESHGVTLPAGCGPTVGIAGLTLGGGLGILGRKHGLTCDRLLAARVVLASGDVVDCDERHHPDLFWALRGAGGGHFGVVTSLVFRTVPAPAATLFRLTWPLRAAADAIAAWQDWAPGAPDECAATLRVAVHDEASGVELIGAMLAGEPETVDLLGELIARCGGEPASASHDHMPYRDAKRTLAGTDAPQAAERSLVALRSEFFRRPLPPAAIGDLVRALTLDRQPGESRELAFTPLGGAYNRVREDATAYVHRSERFLLEHAVTLDGGAPDSARAWVTASWECAHPWGSGRVYPNFPDAELRDWAEAYYGGNHHRLLAVKRTYDPDNVFRFDQGLDPAR